MVGAVGAEYLEAVEGSQEEATTEAMIAAAILPGGVIEVATEVEPEGIRLIEKLQGARNWAEQIP